MRGETNVSLREPQRFRATRSDPSKITARCSSPELHRTNRQELLKSPPPQAPLPSTGLKKNDGDNTKHATIDQLKHAGRRTSIPSPDLRKRSNHTVRRRHPRD